MSLTRLPERPPEAKGSTGPRCQAYHEKTREGARVLWCVRRQHEDDRHIGVVTATDGVVVSEQWYEYTGSA